MVPDADGDGVPDRSRRGAPNAAFMPDCFSRRLPTAVRINLEDRWPKETGAVILADVCSMAFFSGTALGGLALDRRVALFAANRRA